jgi:DNA-nicking Smr family endonuclease
MSDFGKILDQWERTGSSAAPIKKDEEETQEIRVHPRRLPIDDTLDIHGLIVEEATLLLDAFIDKGLREGHTKLMVVHGKGNHSEEEPVLSKAIRELLEADARVGTFGHPERSLGGRGATWFIVRYRSR